MVKRNLRKYLQGTSTGIAFHSIYSDVEPGSGSGEAGDGSGLAGVSLK